MSSLRTGAVYLRQQLASKASTLLIWIIIWSLLLLLFVSVFNSLSKDAAESSKVFQQLPSGVFNSFNIDPSSYLTQVESFISGQFLSVYLLAGSIFAFSLGAGVIGKRIENRTIASQLTIPISRGRLYALEFAANSIFLAIGSALLCIIALILFGTMIQNQASISTEYFRSLFIGSGLLFIALAALGQLIGMLLNGGRSVLVGAAVVVVSWFLNSLAPLAHMPEWLQKFSLFHYFDVSVLRTSYGLVASYTWQLLAITLVFFLIGRIVFQRKNIYL